MTHHLVRSRPLRGSTTCGTFRPKSDKSELSVWVNPFACRRGLRSPQAVAWPAEGNINDKKQRAQILYRFCTYVTYYVRNFENMQSKRSVKSTDSASYLVMSIVGNDTQENIFFSACFRTGALQGPKASIRIKDVSHIFSWCTVSVLQVYCKCAVNVMHS